MAVRIMALTSGFSPPPLCHCPQRLGIEHADHIIPVAERRPAAADACAETGLGDCFWSNAIASLVKIHDLGMQKVRRFHRVLDHAIALAAQSG